MEKTKQDIREEILDNLAVNVGINISEEGSIALAIVDSVIDEIWFLYQELEFVKQQAYLSTSTGQFTDLIGKLVGAERTSLESDDDLKIKASQSIFRLAKGNKIAIEEAALGVDGVASIDYRTYGAGTGSFTLYVYPEAEGNTAQLLERVRQAVSEEVADGIYFEIKEPEAIPISVHLLVQFHQETNAMERQVIRNKVVFVIREYLNQLKRNEVLVINEIISLAMNVSNVIQDVSFLNLMMDGEKRNIANLFPANDERYIAGEIQVI